MYGNSFEILITIVKDTGGNKGYTFYIINILYVKRLDRVISSL